MLFRAVISASGLIFKHPQELKKLSYVIPLIGKMYKYTTVIIFKKQKKKKSKSGVSRILPHTVCVIKRGMFKKAKANTFYKKLYLSFGR